MNSEPWGQVFPMTDENLDGVDVVTFFTTTIWDGAERRPPGRFNYRTNSPRVGVRVLFQYEARIVAVGTPKSKHPADKDSAKGFKGYLVLGDAHVLDRPIDQEEFKAHTRKRLANRLWLLGEDEDPEWFEGRLRS